MKSTYFSSDVENSEILNIPSGNPPYLRGIYPHMYRERLWTMRQYSGFGNAKSTNDRFKYLLKIGQTGLSLAFDLPTQMGYDPDEPIAQAEVGKAGVSIATQEDFNSVFNDINLENISLSMTINATAPVLIALYYNLARTKNLDFNKLSGTIQNDILKEFISRNTYIFPPDVSLQLAIDVWAFCTKFLPKWHFVSVSGYHMREKGASAACELAFTFANAFCYIEEALKRGLNLEKILERISFFFSVDYNFFEEIAKFRAGRVLWHDLVIEKFGKKYSEVAKLRFHIQTGGSILTYIEPENNIVRVAIQALAGIFGGAQSIHTNSYDEAISLPSPKAVKLAIRTQQILAHEFGITEVVDPLAGSFYLENLTQDIYKKVRKLFAEIEKKGGALKCILEGFQQNEIEKESYKLQKEVEEGKKKIIGVNFLKGNYDDSHHCVSSDRAGEKFHETQFNSSFKADINLKERLSYIKNYKDKQNKQKVKAALDRLKKSTAKTDNSVLYIADAFLAGATIGQVIKTLTDIYGRYTPKT